MKLQHCGEELEPKGMRWRDPHTGYYHEESWLQCLKCGIRTRIKITSLKTNPEQENKLTLKSEDSI